MEQQLGRGGMGMVWRARHTGTGRAVALKLIVGRYAGERDVEDRFRREARVLGRLQHPYIVDVSDFGAAQGRLYLVMELLSGKSLRDELIEKGQLPLAQLVDVVDQVALALQHAHEQGVIHRDLKPDNIQLVPAGDRVVVRVLDFGIARLGEAGDEGAEVKALPPSAATEPGRPPSNETEGAALTGQGAVLGTPLYMAPEQFFSQPVSPSTDVYALAAMTWECLTGHPPRIGNANQILVGHLERRAPALDDKRVPWGVRGLLRRAMDPDRKARPTVAEFAGQLRLLAAGADAAYAFSSSQPFPRALLARGVVVLVGAVLAALFLFALLDRATLDALWLLLLFVVMPWLGGGALASWHVRRPRPWLGPVLAVVDKTPRYLWPIWAGLTARFVLGLMVTAVAFVAVALVVAGLTAVEAQLMGTVGLGFTLTAVFTPMLVGLATLSLLTLRQLCAASLVHALERGGAQQLPLRRARVPRWARTATLLALALLVHALTARPLLMRWMRADNDLGVIAMAKLGASTEPGDDGDPLIMAAEKGFDAWTLDPLLEGRSPRDESAALHAAARNARATTLETFASRGVGDTRARDASGRSALSLLADAPPGDQRVMSARILLDADPGVLDVPDADGATPRQRLLALQEPRIDALIAKAEKKTMEKK